jgi:spore photoproduct lyase
LISLAESQPIAEGSVVRDCPGTRYHVCCGYKTIDIIEGCVLSCSYCILKAYLGNTPIKVHPKIEDVIRQIDQEIEANPSQTLRFGTGELSDSLALDRKLRLNQPVMEYFGEKRKAILELKSKWASLDHLLPSLNPFTVVSFSLNPPTLIEKEEKRTSPLHKRLKALRKVQERGSFVGLHFDPVVIYPGFEKDYEYVIEDVCRLLDLKRVLWVSMGLLRFTPNLYHLLLGEKRPLLLKGEFIRGEDGKYRYLKKERVRIYRMFYEMLKSREPDLFIYFCMERSDVWEQVTGLQVRDSGDLISLFDKRISQFYGGVL